MEFSRFKGINLRDAPGAVQDDELVNCINLNIGQAGELTKRTGFSALHDGSTLGEHPVKLLGHYRTDSHSQLLGVANDHLYYSNNGINWISIGDYAATAGVQYADTFYIILSSGDGIISWDGVDDSLLEGAPTGTACVVHKDRLFVIDGNSFSSRVRFSEIGDFSTWPSDNFFDVQPGDGQPPVALAVFQDVVFIFKSQSTWGLYVEGAPENWVLRNVSPEIGCTSSYAVREIEGLLYFVSIRGVYRTDGITFENISEAIETPFTRRSVSISSLNNDSIALWDDRLICHIRFNSVSTRYFVFNIRTGGWVEWVIGNEENAFWPSYFLEIDDEDFGQGLYCGSASSDGRTFMYGAQMYLDAGVIYPASLLTKDYNFDVPLEMKRGKWMGVDAFTQGSINFQHIVDGTALPVELELDNSLAFWDDPNYNWDDSRLNWEGTIPTRRSLYKAEGPGYFRTWQLAVDVYHSTLFVLYGVTLVISRKRHIIGQIT